MIPDRPTGMKQGVRFALAYSPRSTKSDPPIHAVDRGSREFDATSACGVPHLYVIIADNGYREPFTLDTTFACRRCRAIAESLARHGQLDTSDD